MAEGETTVPQAIASDFINVDLPCEACEYNLRGLPLAGNCPECGAKVRNTVPLTGPVDVVEGVEGGGIVLFDDHGIIVFELDLEERTVLNRYEVNAFVNEDRLYIDNAVIPFSARGCDRLRGRLREWGIPEVEHPEPEHLGRGCALFVAFAGLMVSLFVTNLWFVTIVCGLGIVLALYVAIRHVFNMEKGQLVFVGPLTLFIALRLLAAWLPQILDIWIT